MHNKLTKVDIKKMKEELAERRAKHIGLAEEVQRTRAYGDLSENAEYHCAKQEFNRNKSRMAYLERMIKTAVIVELDSTEGVVGLFDKVKVEFPEDQEISTVRIVTTLRCDTDHGDISSESPFGKALLKRHVGDTVIVHVNEQISYPVKILSIEKGEDDASLAISRW